MILIPVFRVVKVLTRYFAVEFNFAVLSIPLKTSLIYKKHLKYLNMRCLFFFHSAEKIIYRYAEIVGECNKSIVVRLPFQIFVSRYRILIHVQIDGKFDLRYFFCFSQFFKSEFHFFNFLFHNHLTLVYHFGIIKISQFGIF